ncbi:MetQ/NlpA family ABC transporter substrate-binding protein [Ancylobacter lacus]|uniref:MetQ/NlpA family ABC transporter substrate-binding protein n=1 Tax=Ancylobacter lacus TaxID=2579970 RepID=UPI001BCD102E|nr:MetQ/NlpA family ABC transporter substrate-binding protein [Ancylobacter lacus]MBS7537568.1 MetQ/NlpA family ABC transporter substrate-binding protein [Ancylobacter lacus]
MTLSNRLLGAALGAALAAIGLLPAHAADTIKLGVIGGDEEEIAEVASKVAAKDGLVIQIVAFSDYTLPNEALSRGDLDANAFQHKPYLDSQIAARGYRIVPAGFTIVEPIGFYSLKLKNFKDLPEGALIGIPNDPSNGGRALNLLAANGLITLAPGKGLLPTVLDVTGNPKKVVFRELDAALLPKQLPDLDGAVINTNYALGAKLDPRKDALVQESRTNNPYGNFIAVRAGDENKPVIVKLVKAYQSPEVKDFLETRFKGAVLPAW